MSQPPIIPGEEPATWQPQNQQPLPHQPPQSVQVPVAKTTGITLTVIAVVFVVFCVLPALLCSIPVILGNIGTGVGDSFN